MNLSKKPISPKEEKPEDMRMLYSDGFELTIPPLGGAVRSRGSSVAGTDTKAPKSESVERLRECRWEVGLEDGR